MSPGPLARRDERDFRATGSSSEELLMTRRWRPSFSKDLRSGGAGRDRTGDLRLAKAALSQLSYSPGRCLLEGLVGLSGFEPLTSRLSAVRSSQLSYRPVVSNERPQESRSPPQKWKRGRL